MANNGHSRGWDSPLLSHSSSHANGATTVVNNYYSVDSHDTSTETVNTSYTVDSHNTSTTTTTFDATLDSHDTATVGGSNLDLGSVAGGLPALPVSGVDVGDLTGNLPPLSGLGVDLGDVAGGLGSLGGPGADLDGATGLIAPVSDSAGDVIGSVLDSATAGGGAAGVEQLAPVALDDIGNIVASIASFDATNPLGGANLGNLGGDLPLGSLGGGLSVTASADAAVPDVSQHAGPADLSHVGALIDGLPLQDIAATNLDLDHLTSSLNLFDTAHIDVGVEPHHT